MQEAGAITVPTFVNQLKTRVLTSSLLHPGALGVSSVKNKMPERGNVLVVLARIRNACDLTFHFE